MHFHTADFIPLTGFEGVEHPGWFVLQLAASMLFDGFVLHRVLFRGTGPLDAERLWHAIVVFSVAFFAKTIALVALGLTAFGLINVVWHDLVYVLPTVALRALIAARRGRTVTWPVRTAAVLALAFLPIAAWARYVEPFRLQIERADVPVPAARAGEEPLRIAILADLQTDTVGPYEVKVIDTVLGLEPDLILMPGDVFHGWPHALERWKGELRAQLQRLDAPGGVFLVRGDVDPPQILDPLIEGTKIRLLEDEVARVTVRGRLVTIAGLGLDERSAFARRAAQVLESAVGDDDVRILMAHHPDAVLNLRQDTRVDLTVAGHTHGGQIVLPFFGPPFTLTGLPRRIAAGGLHELEGRRIYVSRGAGHERTQAPRIRFLCPPEVTLLTVSG